MREDFLYSLRSLRRNPWFTAIAVLALGLGIAAGTALFGLMDAVLLRPVPGIVRPGEFVTFERCQAGQLLGNTSYPDFLDYSGLLRSFQTLSAQAVARLSFARLERVERVGGALVSGNYFASLGVQPSVGRLLIPDDDRQGPEPVAVLSYPFWQRAFGTDSTTVGSHIELNGRVFTIVGVAQSGFRGTDPEFQPDLWVPITLAPIAMPRLTPGVLQNRSSGWLRIIGRLRPGTSLAQAQAEVDQVAAQLTSAHPTTNHLRSMALVAGLGMWSDDRAELRRFLALLLTAVGLLQLLACANVANLLLLRAAARRRETAVRLALGASGLQLTRLFLVEGGLLAGLASFFGVALAPALAKLAITLPQRSSVLREAEVHLDWRVLGFAILMGAGSTIVVTCIPAWKARRTELLAPLRDGSQGSGRSRSLLRGGLVAAQIAISMTLLAAAGTAVETMRRGLMASPIPRPEEVLLCSVDLTIQGYTPTTGERFYDALLDRLQSLPGVTASLGTSVPPGDLSGRISIFYPGQEPPADVLAGHEFELGLRVEYDSVAPAFFRTLGVGLLEGREFEARDSADSQPVAVINGSLARRMWPGHDPIGQRISLGPTRHPVTVIGVMRDVASRSLLGEPPLHLYVPYSQSYDGRAKIVVRSADSHPHLVDAIRAAVSGIDPRLPLYAVETMPEHVANSLGRESLAAAILGAFGFLALTLASIGLYGVVAHGVSQRRREIGIRMAIGARGAQVCTLIVAQAVRWIVAGAAVGLPLAVWSTSFMQKAIPGTKALDPFALCATAAMLGGISLLAALGPSIRAAKSDPLQALRHE